MRKFILFMASVCFAMLCAFAYFDEREDGLFLWAAMAMFLCMPVAAAYNQKFRPWMGPILLCLVAVLFIWAFVDYILTGTLPDITSGGVAGALIGWYAKRNRVAMRNAGFPVWPGDESKTDEELASNTDIKWRDKIAGLISKFKGENR